MVSLGTAVLLCSYGRFAPIQAPEAERQRFVVPADSLPDFVRFVPNGVPRSWVESEGGDLLEGQKPPELPGFYLTYRHGTLEYLFGPYTLRSRLTLDRSLLLGLEDSLQRRDATTYRFVEISIARVVGNTASRLSEAEEEALYDPLFRDAELLDRIQARLAGHEYGSPIGIDDLTRIAEDLVVIRAGGGNESLGRAVEVARRFSRLATEVGKEALDRMSVDSLVDLRRRAEEAVWKEVTGAELPSGQAIGAAANGLDLREASAGLQRVLLSTDPESLAERMAAGRLPPDELRRMATSPQEADLVAARAAVAFLAEQETQERMALSAGTPESVVDRARVRAESGEELNAWEGRMLAEAMQRWTQSEEANAAVEDGASQAGPARTSSPEDQVLELLRIGLRLREVARAEGTAQGALEDTFQPTNAPVEKPKERSEELETGRNAVMGDPRGHPLGHPDGHLDGSLDGRVGGKLLGGETSGAAITSRDPSPLSESGKEGSRAGTDATEAGARAGSGARGPAVADSDGRSDGGLYGRSGGKSKDQAGRRIDPRLENAIQELNGIEDAIEGRGLQGTDAAAMARSFQRLAGEAVVRRMERRAGIPKLSLDGQATLVARARKRAHPISPR
jgi:hypothetical protein